MKARHVLFTLLAMLITAFPLIAQPTPSIIAVLEAQKPKNGMIHQYEEGRKQKAAWHKQQNDSQPLYVWETLSGPDTGTYLIGRLNQHWADFDKPSIPEEADFGEYQKVIGNYVDSLVTHYYEFLPKFSSTGNSSPTDKFAEILTFHVKYGKASEFRSAMLRVNEAAQKTKWPVDFVWYSLTSGGVDGTYILVLPHKSWADFEDKPDTKPFRVMLADAFGPDESGSILDRIDGSVQAITTEIIEFRPELSYLPTK
jgi:hypothetical protein